MTATDDFRILIAGRFEWERVFRRIVVPSRFKSVKVVGMMLASFANADGTSIFPGAEGLAGFCQGGKTTVGQSLEWMRDNHVVRRNSHRASRAGRRLADEYQLTMPSDWETRFTLLPPNGHDVDLVIPRPRRGNNPNPLGSTRKSFDVETDRKPNNQRLVDPWADPWAQHPAAG